MGVVHCRNPRNGIVYVYSSFSYWDKETKSKKAIRKLIGKLDEHGNVVPTNGHPGRPKKNKSPESEPVKPAAADSESVKTVATDTNQLLPLIQVSMKIRVRAKPSMLWKKEFVNWSQPSKGLSTTAMSS